MSAALEGIRWTGRSEWPSVPPSPVDWKEEEWV